MMFDIFNRDKNENSKYSVNISLSISGIYFVFGVLWILVSDRLLIRGIEEAERIHFFSMLKGMGYVLISTLFLYYLINLMLRKLNSLQDKFTNSYMQLEKTRVELEEAHKQIVCSKEEIERNYIKLEENQMLLEESEERYRLSLECSNDSIWEWDISSDVLSYDKTKLLLGYQPSDLRDSMDDFICLIHGDDKGFYKKRLNMCLNRQIPFFRVEVRVLAADGEYRWLICRGKTIGSFDGKYGKIAGSHSDITERKNYERKIHNLAYYDTLTKLPNKVLFESILNEYIHEREKDNIAVLYMDLDNFKRVNDTLGHSTGDKLLMQVAKTLQKKIREGDTVARFGGDEFGLLIKGFKDIDEVHQLAGRFLKIFSKPFEIQGHEYYISVSIGVTVFPEDAREPQALLMNADTAMYHAKTSGKNTYSMFSPYMNSAVIQKLEMENSLRKAIENGELTVFYQPIVNIMENRITGTEALIRWRHPEKGLLSPMEFIPLAEETGLIVDIGEWVIRTVCRKALEWKEKGYGLVPVSINLSSRELQQPDFVDNVKKILNETGADPQLIQMEITESLAMKNIDRTVAILKELKKLGIKFSLDDFGTGYSSLSYLSKLPIDILKIDKSFIMPIQDVNEVHPVTEAVISIAHNMQLFVTAEGVETPEQLQYIQSRQCHNAQGYYFSKPLPANELEMKYYQSNKNIPL